MGVKEGGGDNKRLTLTREEFDRYSTSDPTVSRAMAERYGKFIHENPVSEAALWELERQEQVRAELEASLGNEPVPHYKWAYWKDKFYLERLVGLLNMVHGSRSRRSISGELCAEVLSAGAAVMGDEIKSPAYPRRALSEPGLSPTACQTLGTIVAMLDVLGQKKPKLRDEFLSLANNYRPTLER